MSNKNLKVVKFDKSIENEEIGENNSTQKNLPKLNVVNLKELLDNINKHSFNLKLFELNKNYPKATEVVEKIILLINQSIKHEQLNNTLTSPNLKLLQTLLSSYTNKKSSYDYSQFIDKKTQLIKEKMTEKYLGKRRMTKDEMGNNINPPQNPSNISEYEIVPSSSHSNIIKEIVDICSSLLKYYELLTETKNKPENNLKNLKSFQAYESFFIYDYHNTTANVNPGNKIEKYMEEIKIIKFECEKIIDSDILIDTTKLKSLEKQIGIIKEEFQKIYPKYQNLKEILLKNNLIKKQK
jgi:hypothetical protein